MAVDTATDQSTAFGSAFRACHKLVSRSIFAASAASAAWISSWNSVSSAQPFFSVSSSMTELMLTMLVSEVSRTWSCQDVRIRGLAISTGVSGASAAAFMIDPMLAIFLVD